MRPQPRPERQGKTFPDPNSLSLPRRTTPHPGRVSSKTLVALFRDIMKCFASGMADITPIVWATRKVPCSSMR